MRKLISVLTTLVDMSTYSIVKTVAHRLTDFIVDDVISDGYLDVFCGSNIPKISISAYVFHMERHAQCSHECYIIAMILINRLTTNIPTLTLTKLNVHRLFLTALLIAIKLHDDDCFKNSYYAKIGGISPAEFQKLEIIFLELLNYDIFVSSQTYNKFLS